MCQKCPADGKVCEGLALGDKGLAACKSCCTGQLKTVQCPDKDTYCDCHGYDAFTEGLAEIISWKLGTCESEWCQCEEAKKCCDQWQSNQPPPADYDYVSADDPTPTAKPSMGS